MLIKTDKINKLINDDKSIINTLIYKESDSAAQHLICELVRYGCVWTQSDWLRLEKFTHHLAHDLPHARITTIDINFYVQQMLESLQHPSMFL